MRNLLLAACGWTLAGVGTSHAEEIEVPYTPDPIVTVSDGWIDRVHNGVYSLVWRSSMYVDRLFGSDLNEWEYQKQVRGSITPAVLWDEFNGFDPKFRFRVKLPLPHLDDRYDAFIGTFSRDEYVTGREPESGAIARQHVRGGVEEDETLIGIRYREPRQGGRFSADAGLRIRSPIDPFVKGTYRYQRGTSERVLLTLRETVFWQNSEQFGVTTRVDLERIIDATWLARWTLSGTFSEESEGVRGYTALTAYRGFPGNRAVGMQIFSEGEFDAAVPLGEYGMRVAYRQSFVRDWLVIEIRPSVTWPKENPGDPRKASWGLGIGFEMFFGDNGFEARPATF
jgi:hypothetical protein